jgi:hypothetical protein
MHKAKITSAEKVRHQASNTEFIDVAFDIVNAEGEVVETRRIGLDVASSKEDVAKEVSAHVKEYENELENKKVDKKREAANANVRDIQENLVGSEVEISSDSEPVEEGDGESEN